MGIATWHEVKPVSSKPRPRKPTLDEMGPGTESKIYRPGSKIFQPTDSRQSGPEFGPAPRSSGGAPGHRGGWKKR
jgi:excinuclease ABC subunit B